MVSFRKIKGAHALGFVGSCWLLGCTVSDPEDGAPAAIESDGAGTSGGHGNAAHDTSAGGPGDGGADTDGADAGTSGGSDVPPEPDAAAMLFSHDYLPVYRITMEGSNWAEAWDVLLDHLDPEDKCEERPFIEADLAFENPWTGQTELYAQVGFRIRGHDLPGKILDQDDERFGFKMSFSRFVSDREFHGNERLNFLSSEHDDTLMKQCLMYELLRDFDVPAARCNFASVYVNDDYVGVFAHVEERDDGSYLRNRFPDDPSGSLYEFGDCWGDEDDVLTDLGPEPEPYVATYQLEAGTDEADLSNDLIPFMQCVSSPHPELVGCIEQHIDLEEWHRAMAAHFIIPDMDGWAPSSTNFMLYHYGPQGTPRRFVIYPWDVDRAFKDDCHKNDSDGGNHLGPCHIMGYAWEDGDSPELANRLREPPFRSGYCAAAQAFVEQHFNPEAMAARVNDLRARPRQAAKPFDGLVAPSLDELMERDPLWDFVRFDDELTSLLEVKVANRHAAVLEQLTECESSPLLEN